MHVSIVPFVLSTLIDTYNTFIAIVTQIQWSSGVVYCDCSNYFFFLSLYVNVEIFDELSTSAKHWHFPSFRDIKCVVGVDADARNVCAFSKIVEIFADALAINIVWLDAMLASDINYAIIITSHERKSKVISLITINVYTEQVWLCQVRIEHLDTFAITASYDHFTRRMDWDTWWMRRLHTTFHRFHKLSTARIWLLAVKATCREDSPSALNDIFFSPFLLNTLISYCLPQSWLTTTSPLLLTATLRGLSTSVIMGRTVPLSSTSTLKGLPCISESLILILSWCWPCVVGVYMTEHTPGWVGVMVQGTCLFEGSVSWQESCSSGKGTVVEHIGRESSVWWRFPH